MSASGVEGREKTGSDLLLDPEALKSQVGVSAGAYLWQKAAWK